MPPEPDLAAIHAFCRRRFPADSVQGLRVEVLVEGRTVTIVERRPPWPPRDAEWTTLGVARMRYIASRGEWELYEPAANGLWRRYTVLSPTPRIARVIEELERDVHGTFWG